MKFIVDSGSTKADWALCRDSEIVASFQTIGFNPYFMNSDEVLSYLNQRQDLHEYAQHISEIYFYGAGCSDPQLNQKISSALSRFFSKAQVWVDHDLTAAAFALYESKPIIACILGTGSNSCYYDGQILQEVVPALGYILGDEGSGSYFGKTLIRDHQYRRMPTELSIDFEMEYETRWNEIVKKVYQSSAANVHLASYFPFAVKHRTHPYIIEMVESGFDFFLENHVMCYPQAASRHFEVSFIGSIGHFFKPLLLTSLEKKGLKPGKIIQKPIEGLVAHHTKTNKNAIQNQI